MKLWAEIPRNVYTRAFVYALGDTLIRVGAFFLARMVVPVPVEVLLLYLPFKTFASLLFRTPLLPWRHFSMVDAFRVAGGEIAGSGLAALFWALSGGVSLPFVLMEALASLVGVEAFRMARRAYSEVVSPADAERRLVIYGAGFGGEQVLRTFQRDRRYRPVAILDDDPAKWGALMHGIPVVGGRRWLRRLRKEGVDALLIAIPSAPARVIREIFEEAREAGYTDIRAMPDFYEWFHADHMPPARPIRIEDLLRRPPVPLDEEGMERLLQGKVVWVTGAAGSIGSELAEVVHRFHPRKLCLLDINESDLYLLAERLGGPVHLSLADIRDPRAFAELFSTHPPDVIFHAAALKHVPVVETHPREGVWTNVLGTLHLVQLAREHGVPHFVLISTDKAVNPSSVMGATKRLAERIVTGFAEPGKFFYTAVRFGNVLGSRGSVIPIFEQQLARGGPLTVTHPEMRRYFMAPKEAVFLILQAALLSRGEGEVFVLDMGEPVSILELAETFLRLKGYEPYRDVEIVFSGPRPGEKLFEELLQAEEGVEATPHEKVFRARIREALSREELLRLEEELRSFLSRTDPSFWRKWLREWVPTYRPESISTESGV